jgi:hypothetical protein
MKRFADRAAEVTFAAAVVLGLVVLVNDIRARAEDPPAPADMYLRCAHAKANGLYLPPACVTDRTVRVVKRGRVA